ncbi:hypothetical protein [Nitratireductor indicus]|nr:hypothetical protein [Nitratireductor indicus]MDS1135106.1 hypothetical protein [Nitratireductor indicus]
MTALFALSACQGGPGGTPLSLGVNSGTPVSVLQHINNAGAKCWMRSGDRQFRGLHLIPELDTTAGRPRLLIMKSSDRQGLPQLVIEASGTPPRITTYGPLVTGATGARVNADVTRWAGGPDKC